MRREDDLLIGHVRFPFPVAPRRPSQTRKRSGAVRHEKSLASPAQYLPEPVAEEAPAQATLSACRAGVVSVALQGFCSHDAQLWAGKRAPLCYLAKV